MSCCLRDPTPCCYLPGIVGAVVLPVTGVSVGAVQVVRGIINTPEAISRATQGKLWDEVSYHAWRSVWFAGHPTTCTLRPGCRPAIHSSKTCAPQTLHRCMAHIALTDTPVHGVDLSV